MDDLTKLSDEKLGALVDDLAAKRTQIRLAQNAVAAEVDLRRALNSMPVESRRIYELRLTGHVAPAGEASQGKE